MFQVTLAYTNASTLYSECSSVRWTKFQVTSAYTANASTLYSESSSVRWTMFQVTSAYTNASTQPTKKYYFTAKIILKYYSGEYSKLGHFDIFLIWIMVVHNILN